MIKNTKTPLLKIINFSVVIALAFIVTTAGCTPKEYSAAPMGGRVIDKVTKKPISGAYVVALYGLHGGLHGTYIAPLHYEEVRTDENGYFHFNGFTNIPIDYSRAPKGAVVLDYDPMLNFFAEGYLPWKAFRNIQSTPSGPHLKSALDGIVMELEPNTSIAKEDARMSRPFISGLYGNISLGYHDGKHLHNKCAIVKLPQTLRYISEIESKFENTIAYSRQVPLYIYKKCGFQGE